MINCIKDLEKMSSRFITVKMMQNLNNNNNSFNNNGQSAFLVLYYFTEIKKYKSYFEIYLTTGVLDQMGQGL